MNASNTMSNTMPKLNPKQMLKSLPKGFTAISIPAKTRTVFLQIDTSVISKEDAKNAVNKLCKELGLAVEYERLDNEPTCFCLKDPAFNKEMLAEAKTCLKVVKSFFSKYRNACRYDNVVGDIANKIVNVVTNSEL